MDACNVLYWNGLDAVAQWLKCRTNEGGIPSSNPTGGTSLRNFGNSVYPIFSVSFGGDNKTVGPFYLVSMPGEVKYPT